MATLTLTIAPAIVNVSDDRSQVPGIAISGDLIGEAIPAEGDGLDCWLGFDLAQAVTNLPDHVYDSAVEALEDAAASQTAGTIQITDDGEFASWTWI